MTEVRIVDTADSVSAFKEAATNALYQKAGSLLNASRVNAAKEIVAKEDVQEAFNKTSKSSVI